MRQQVIEMGAPGATSEAVGDAGSISAKLTVRRTGGGVWNPFASSSGGASLRCGDETPVKDGVRSALGRGVRACNSSGKSNFGWGHPV